MAWKEVQPANPGGDIWDFDTFPELIGTLQDIQEDVGPNKSMLYHIKDETTEGKVWGVWGSTVLDDRMKEVRNGEKVRIVFSGMEKSKKGGSYKMFKVYIFSNE